MNQAKITFVGAGNMAGAILNGFIQSGYPTRCLSASARSDTRLAPFAEKGVSTSTNNAAAVNGADVIVLGVKPQQLPEVCRGLAGAIKADALILSLAAGVHCQSISDWLAGDFAIVRCMSNTPSQIGKGASGLYGNDKVSDKQRSLAETIINAVGLSVWVEEEGHIDAVTAVAGSAPAYFFLFLEAMIDAAVNQGLNADDARDLAVQTALGAAELAQQNDLEIAELRNRVTSPGGTTAQALASFEDSGLREIVAKAMFACAERGRELSKT